MEANLQRLEETSLGLFYLSEGDYPFEVFSFDTAVSLEDSLHKLSGNGKKAPMRVVPLEQFFRNMTTPPLGSSPKEQQRAQRFLHLQQVLREDLQEVTVYLLGEIEVDAFILGKTSEGSYAGLRTKVIQT
jgi:hypothetical protein